MDELHKLPDVKKTVADIFEEARQQEKLKGWIAQIAPLQHRGHMINIDNTKIFININ